MPDALIFDDDPAVGSLVGELLRQRGLTSAHFPSGAGVQQIVAAERPRLVVLDIMMPGVDGLTACRSIRSTPATRHVKIVVLTAKHFEQDRETARRYGADLFVNKPFNAAALSDALGRLLGAAEGGPAPAAPAAPLVASLLPGGFVLQVPGLWLFFDAGAGVSRWLEGRTQAPPLAWLLLSRYEDEAIAELGSFAPLLESGCRLNAAGPDDADSLLQRLAPRMGGTPGFKTAKTPLLYPQREGELQLAPGVMAATRYTQHAGSCLAWRLDVQGRRVVWCPANEVPPVAADWNRHEREKFRSLFEEADLLIHGFGRSMDKPADEKARFRGAWEPVVALARDARVKKLALLPMGGASGAGIVDAIARTGASGSTEVRVVAPGTGWIL